MAVLHLDLPLVRLCGHSGCSKSHHHLIIFLPYSIYKMEKKNPKESGHPFCGTISVPHFTIIHGWLIRFPLKYSVLAAGLLTAALIIMYRSVLFVMKNT